MSFTSNQNKIRNFSIIAGVFTLAMVIGFKSVANTDETSKSYIISAKNFSVLKDNLKALGVIPTHELKIIDSVAVDLTDEQLSSLQQKQKVTINTNHKVKLNGQTYGQRRWQPKSVVTEQVDATYVHQTGNFGEGVTIGFLDTGLEHLSGLSTDLYGRDKAWGTYDAINDTVSNHGIEESGHGTHVASIAVNSDYDSYGQIYGVAPNAAHVGIKAFDAEGKATYADVIRGISWALDVKEQINLRILNMSFSGPVRSNYWEDPLNKAVMKAWQAGVVVVASAGNKGSAPMTIGVPGNVPYIITVGAMTDNYTAFNYNDDKVATFSSAGPTPEGFVKPDIIAPGGHISGLMAFDSQIVSEHPEYHDGGRYFEMSGTSQAAAVVSGVVALMLTDNPELTPDQVKCKLMDSAYSADNQDGSMRYSVFQQGAGLVSAYYAIESAALNCANNTLDIAKDLSDEEHFYGPVNINQDGNFYVEGLGPDFIWKLDQEQLNGDALIWKMGFNDPNMAAQSSASTNALIWKMDFETDALIWKLSLESDALIWKMNFDTNQVTTISVNNWVEPQ
jgi:serine protease AprX